MKKIISLLLLVFILSTFAGAAVSADAIDTYIVGDADGDENISVLDATRVQRVLAGLASDEDGKSAMRGDVTGNGLDIVDATLIQRFVAGFDDQNDIGKIVGLVAPTEAPTQMTEAPTEPATVPATQGPTRDPDELPYVPKN